MTAHRTPHTSLPIDLPRSAFRRSLFRRSASPRYPFRLFPVPRSSSPRSPFRWSALALAVLALSLYGCKTLARQLFAQPVVEVKDVKVRAVGLQGGSLDVILDIYNPNEYRLDATAITYKVWVDSNEVATGTIEKMLSLSEKGRSEIVVPVDFTFAAVQKAIQGLARRGYVEYRVAGEASIATPFGKITRPYSGTGRWDSLK
jgi:LEA14-like dessication related protein